MSSYIKIQEIRGLLWWSVVKNLPSNEGDVGLISSQGSKIPHAVEQLNPCTTTIEPVLYSPRSCNHRTLTPQLLSPHALTKDLHVPQ